MKKTKIEWADATWNPVTGCFHGCEYCYARGIVNRFGGYWDENALRSKGALGVTHDLDAPMYRHTTGKNRDKGVHSVVSPYPYCFDPTLHRYKLNEPQKWTEPRTIFVCSMADLFGEWIPDSWIKSVFDACRAAPQHRYLFLTKNPARYQKIKQTGLDMPKNCWIGTTVTCNDDEQEHTRTLLLSENWNMLVSWFVSVEPLLEKLSDKSIENIASMHWVIIGAESGNRNGKVIPKKEWIDEIVAECDKCRVPVFMKDSLIPIVGEENMRRELPWEVQT